ncbi:ribosome biogenesis GTPase Der [Seleniivibrio woodruffii]|uniref:ribosome biogenesis GTPase Der n=1 Tax=Seleniivibrio woodruffii TaxID=1078050 RepID=UPI0026F37B95|nr:ribosome biogenesis GTPase Der [Seleniivibrio woodruffii]
MFTIGIIGRPNVGKSTLFNRLAGKKIAIVDDMPGVTRDRIEFVTDWNGHRFNIVDTAGFDLKEELLKKEMQAQFMNNLREADYFILMTDGQEGVHPLDEIVIDLLRQTGKPYQVVVNKVDSDAKETLTYDFYRLGVEDIIGISATHGRNVDELLDRIVEQIPEDSDKTDPYEGRIKLIVTGRPNVGKSSMINKWLGQDRLIVTPIPGTTRDAVDTFFEYEDQKYVLIDTAGIRKKKIMFKDKIEKYGYHRWEDAVSRADIAVCIIDSNEGLTDRDVKVIADNWEAGRPVILVANKWDLIENKDEKAKDFHKDIDHHLQFLNKPSLIYTSTLTGKNIFKVFEAAKELYKEYSKRISTHKLQEVLEEAVQRHQPPVTRNRRVKFYFITQVSTCPPEFVVFVNYPDAVHFSYQRFIVNIIRAHHGFDGVPIKIHFRQRGESRNTPISEY